MDFSKYREEFVHAAIGEGHSVECINTYLSYAERLNSQGLPIIYDQNHLAHLVGCNYTFLVMLCNAKNLYYKNYKIPKKNGSVRLIQEPFPSLKEIQHWILKNILEPASKDNVSLVAKAFMPKKKLRENARFHKRRKCVVALDIEDFFGSIDFGSVYGVFKRLGYTKSVCAMLANLCICDNSLPQGAPTSPMLSNMVFKATDDKLFSYCRSHDVVYTRYADDMTFSSDTLNPTRIISYVKMLIAPRGFRLNDKKTKVMGCGMRQEVTGVIVNQKLQVSRVYRDKIRQEIYYSIKFGLANHMTRVTDLPSWIKTPHHYGRHLYGKVDYVLQINPHDATFLKYREWLKEYLKS